MAGNNMVASVRIPRELNPEIQEIWSEVVRTLEAQGLIVRARDVPLLKIYAENRAGHDRAKAIIEHEGGPLGEKSGKSEPHPLAKLMAACTGREVKLLEQLGLTLKAQKRIPGAHDEKQRTLGADGRPRPTPIILDMENYRESGLT